MPEAVERSDLDRFRAAIARRLGLRHDDDKLALLADVLHQRLAATRCSDYSVYAERLDSPLHGGEELRALAELLTVGETYFFRVAEHFRAVAELVLPARLKARARDRTLRLLSAGCASGEEPYSLAMVLAEQLPDLATWDVEILAVDVNPAALAKAAAGRYSAWSLRATPAAMTQRYFTPRGQDFELAAGIRRAVTFEERNLAAADALPWRPGKFDLVFCRNVLMYFEPDAMRAVVDRLGQSLCEGGYLFLGPAETLRGVSQRFHLCHSHDTFYYQCRTRLDEPLPAGAPARFDVLDGALPDVFDTSRSWVDAIRQASERIAALAARRPHEAAGPAPAATPPRSAPWDKGPVLEELRQERYAEALRLLGARPAGARDEPEALLLHAVLLTHEGRLPEAETVCARLLALDELNAGAHYVMALCREHAGDAPGAVEHDQTAVYLDPTFAMPHVHQGLIARRAGDLPAAQRELARAAELLAREDGARLLLFGGGFSRDALLQLCLSGLRAAGGSP